MSASIPRGGASAWAGCPAVELDVACSGADHRLVWSEGTVTALDHPELDAERALVALGGPTPACLDLIDLWAEAVADGGFLGEWVDQAQLTDARLSWLAMALERMRGEGFHEFLRRLPLTRAERMGQFLHRFPRAWHDRAAGAVAAAVVDGPGVRCADAPSLVPLGVASRLRRAFVTSVGGRSISVGAAALVPLTISVTPDAAPAAWGQLRGPDRGVSLTVPTRWLHQVWGVEAAVVDHHLVLDRCPDPSHPDRARLTVVSWAGEGNSQPEVTERGAIIDANRWTWA